MGLLSDQSLDALAEVVTGGSGVSGIPEEKRHGVYRAGYKLPGFFDALSLPIKFDLQKQSRVFAVREYLGRFNDRPDAEQIYGKIICAALNPRAYIQLKPLLERSLRFLNDHLEFDGFEVALTGKELRLRRLAESAPAPDRLIRSSTDLNNERVNELVQRALANADGHPDIAITDASSMVESVCAALLQQMGVEPPKSKDIDGYINLVMKQLNLHPSRTDLPEDILADVKQILGGIMTVTKGVGALRTHGGNAHGSPTGKRRVDGRIARLVIHSASAVALFLLETWRQQKGKASPSD